MDIPRLYPQAGSTGNNGSLKYTASIQNIPIDTPPFPDAYYLGYMRHWFDWQKTTQATYNPETNEILFNDVTDYTAYPSIGYGAHIYGAAMFYISNYFYDTDLSKFVNATGTDKYLLNNFHPQATSMRNLALDFVLLGINNNDSAPHSYVTFTSIADFLDFYNGNRSITLIDSYYGRTYTIYRSDLTNDGYYDTHDDTRFVLKQGYFDSDSYFDDNSIAYTSYRPQIFVQSNYLLNDESKSSVTFGECNSVEWGSLGLYIYNGNPYIYKCLPKAQTEDGNTVITAPFIGHLAGKFNTTEWFRSDRVGQWAIIDSDGEGRTYILSERNARDYPLGFIWQETIENVYKNASLYRWTTSNIYGYSDGVAYYPTFNPDDTNEFTLKLQTGTQTDLQPLLPIWYRLDNIQASDYTDADKPAPTPEDEVTTEKHNGENSLPALAGIRTVSGDAFSTFYHLSMYHVAELGQLISQMPQSFWEALGTATDYKQANILDYLVSLKWYPLNIADSTDTVTSDLQFGFNGIAKITFTAAGTSYKIGNINRIYDMGSITIPYRGGSQSFLDLEPYTSVSAYLPYIGTVSLQANDVVGYTITCTYIVDLTTGMCTGILDNGTDTIYIGTGKIGVDISVSGNDILTQAEKMASSYIGAASSAISNTLSLGASVADANVAGAASAMISAVTDLATSAIGIANSKRGIPETVGSASGFGGAYTHQAPYIRVQRPAVSIPGKYGHDVGYVCNRSYTIGTLSGYTVCSNPDLSGIPATSAELDMIRTLMTSGFYA